MGRSSGGGGRSGGGAAAAGGGVTTESTNNFFTGGSAAGQLESEERGFVAANQSGLPPGTTVRERFETTTFRMMQGPNEGVAVAAETITSGGRNILEVDASRVVGRGSSQGVGRRGTSRAPLQDRNASSIRAATIAAARSRPNGSIIRTVGDPSRAESSAYRRAGFSAPTGSGQVQYAVVRGGRLVPADRVGQPL